MHTIDMKHCFLLNEFKNDDEEHIPKLISLKKTLSDKLRKTTNKQIDERLRLKDEIKETIGKIGGLVLLIIGCVLIFKNSKIESHNG